MQSATTLLAVDSSSPHNNNTKNTDGTDTDGVDTVLIGRLIPETQSQEGVERSEEGADEDEEREQDDQQGAEKLEDSKGSEEMDDERLPSVHTQLKSEGGKAYPKLRKMSICLDGVPILNTVVPEQNSIIETSTPCDEDTNMTQGSSVAQTQLLNKSTDTSKTEGAHTAGAEQDHKKSTTKLEAKLYKVKSDFLEIPVSPLSSPDARSKS